MSVHKLNIIRQEPRPELIRHAPATLDFTQSIIVNREQLSEAHRNARFVSKQLHRIEDISELDYEELSDLCRAIYYTAEALGAMLHEKGAA